MRRSSIAHMPITHRRSFNLDGTGARSKNLFLISGAVRVIDLAFLITEAATLTNLTNVCLNLYDGSTTVDVTADGVDLSAATVGTLFLKDKVVTESLSVYSANQPRVSEITNNDDLGKPFTAVSAYGVDTYLRISYATTDNPIDVDVFAKLIYQPLDSGFLVPV